jgi:hypothetical protein
MSTSTLKKGPNLNVVNVTNYAQSMIHVEENLDTWIFSKINVLFMQEYHELIARNTGLKQLLQIEQGVTISPICLKHLHYN